jgi:hypothetical protein
LLGDPFCCHPFNCFFLGGDDTTGTERVLVDAYYNGVTVLSPIEELWFVKSRDRHWMPEAFSLEGQYLANLAHIGQLVYTRNRTAADLATVPTLSGVGLRYQEVTLSAAEKEMRLAIYKSPEGATGLFDDLESQIDNATITGVAVGGANLQWQIPLGNFRMDMKELIFTVHRVAQTDLTRAGRQGVSTLSGVGSYAGSYLESDASVGSILYSPAENLATLQSYASMVPIVSYQLFSNGKQIFSSATTDLINRTVIRKHYHPGSQIKDNIYCISFAQFPEDSINATGHMSAAVLGNLLLRIEIADPGPSETWACEVWSHSYNVTQARAGGITKALN